jgi:hypothetical protein
MTRLSLHYIAGLITGEGCFALAVRKRRPDPLQIIPIFQLFMNDRETIQLLESSLRAYGLPVGLAERKNGIVGVWAHGAKTVKLCTSTFAPLLTGQKRRAALVVEEFIASRSGHTSSNARYTDEEIALVRRLREINGNTKGRKSPLTYSRTDPRTLRAS